MANMVKKLPWLRVLLYFLGLWLATRIAGIVPVLSDFWFFGLVSVLCSWLLLKAEGKTLASLHLLPRNRQHWLQCLAGILIGLGLMLLTTSLTFYFTFGHVNEGHIACSPAHFEIVLVCVADRYCLFRISL